MPVNLTLAGLVVREHELAVPLDHERPDGEQITVFAREIADPDGLERPFLLFLQGGPGFEAPRVATAASALGWITRALTEFRVLMLDQRGTGRSTPVGVRTLAARTPAEQAGYLTHFRADSIVRDAELLREALGGERWSVLGQSFGGFCALHYLSSAPDGLREVLFTGGVPPIGGHPDEVYTATYGRILERVRRHHERYPDDADRARAIARTLATEDVRLPDGDRLTWRRLRQAGHGLGMSTGSGALHHLLELPVDSPGFLHDAQDPLGVVRNPIYAIIHEACYADGGVTGWSAERVQPGVFSEPPEATGGPGRPWFTGEHVYPWMFEEYGGLAPLREAAEILAAHEWPRLYDPEVLARNEVPAAAAVYAEDTYVERVFSEATAAQVRGLRPWLTSEYDHDGLRVDGERILGRLLDLARGRV